jgi:glutaconate CoA-transferase subunit B
MSAPATVAEVMAVTIARRLGDGETIAVGSVSPIPASACLLARATHAPQARLILLGNADRFPFNGGMQEFYNFAMRGKLDVFFGSGAQIDEHGNFNLSVIGDYAKPKVRLPGGRAQGVLPFVVKRFYLFRTDHSRRVFVPRVDFITAPGTSPDNVYRPGGLAAVITDLCVLEFSKERARLELASLHPGVALEEVEAKTGFPLHAPSPVPPSPTPTARELELLRGSVREELETFYPEYVRAHASAG